MKATRGSALLAVLLVTTLLLITGMALLSAKSSEYEEAARLRQAAQAKMLAESGLVDFETKVIYGFDFPPPLVADNPFFLYSEKLTQADGTPLGSYTVKLDRSVEKSPHRVWKVTSVGSLGPSDAPVATHTSYGEMDVSPNLREDRKEPNPNYLHWVNFEPLVAGAGGG